MVSWRVFVESCGPGRARSQVRDVAFASDASGFVVNGTSPEDRSVRIRFVARDGALRPIEGGAPAEPLNVPRETRLASVHRARAATGARASRNVSGSLAAAVLPRWGSA